MLDALGNVGDFIGGIGVVVTLLYLAIQIRHNTEQTRLNTASDAWSGILASWEPVYFGDNSKTYQRGLAGEIDPSAPEYLLFSMLMIRTFGQFELSLYQARHGALDDELLAMHSRLVQSVVTSPGGRYWWENGGSHLLGKDFVAHVSTILEAPDPRVRGWDDAEPAAPGL